HSNGHEYRYTFCVSPHKLHSISMKYDFRYSMVTNWLKDKDGASIKKRRPFQLLYFCAVFHRWINGCQFQNAI
ncbi:hypothetical protein, partial [Escherichia coli]|uniref:hypothetical protein n=1 Tax=Escherichia coli TaxID=562 RepID=UPI001CCEA477